MNSENSESTKPNIYIILKKYQNRRINDYQQLIIDTFSQFKDKYKINIKFVDLYFDYEFQHILNDELIFFDKDFAYNNIDVVKSYNKGVILINNETVFFRKINKLNPINEELAINHNFKIAYLTDEVENTNHNYKIIVDRSNYLFDLNTL